MTSLIREKTRAAREPGWNLLGALGLMLASLAMFFLLPGDLAQKTHLALHGLCAQRPSHSLLLGNDALPMDARMTGIYLGAATTLAWLVAAGRARSVGRLPLPVLAMLAVFVVAMALDGFNALLLDLRLPHPYEPSNILRLVTGILAGTVLGTGLGYLFAVSMWRRVQQEQALVSRLAEFGPPVAIAGALGALTLSGLPILYAPYAVGLVVAAIAVFWVLCMVLLALMTNRAWGFRSYREMTGLAMAAWTTAVMVIGMLAVARLGAEQALGLPKLT